MDRPSDQASSKDSQSGKVEESSTSAQDKAGNAHESAYTSTEACEPNPDSHGEGASDSSTSMTEHSRSSVGHETPNGMHQDFAEQGKEGPEQENKMTKEDTGSGYDGVGSEHGLSHRSVSTHPTFLNL